MSSRGVAIGQTRVSPIAEGSGPISAEPRDAIRDRGPARTVAEAITAQFRKPTDGYALLPQLKLGTGRKSEAGR